MTYFFTYCITNKFTLKLNYKYGDMSMNHEVKKHQNLLNEKGNLNEPGYSKVEVFNYDRKQIKVSNCSNNLNKEATMCDSYKRRKD